MLEFNLNSPYHSIKGGINTEFYKARPRLPQDLQGLLTSELTAAINEANLGIADRQIAMRYLVDKLPQIDIAAELNCNRNTVSSRINSAIPNIQAAAHRLNIPQ